MKPNILLILHLPPPIHGASTMGKYIQDSQTINEEFNCTFINLATAESMVDIGKFKLNKIIVFIKLLIQIYKTVKRVKPQLVYITPNAKGAPFYKDFIVVQFLKMIKCNIIAHYHNKGVKEKENNILDNILYNLFFKNIKVILLSKTLYNDISKYVKKKNVHICPNGIPDTTEKEHSKNNIIHQLLYLSNLQKEKGIIDILNACKILKDKGYAFECNIIGGETIEINRKILSEEINKRNLNDRVYFLGKKYGSEKNYYYNKTDIFLFPTYYHNECFPVVLLEAMQYGCVCISTNEGGILDIIDNNINGFIVEKNNSSMLAEKIEILFNNKKLMSNMGKASIEKYTQNFTLDKFEKNILFILKNSLINDSIHETTSKEC